jgi:hypothetical protein
MERYTHKERGEITPPAAAIVMAGFIRAIHAGWTEPAANLTDWIPGHAGDDSIPHLVIPEARERFPGP